MKTSLRQAALQVHLWAGLTIGLVLVATAISGAVLVWRPQLEARLDPRLMVVQPGGTRLAPDELVARARAAHPADELEGVRYYGDPTAPFLVYFSSREYVHLNPYTGEVLGVRRRYGDGFGWLEGFHKFLQLEPTVGEPVTGSISLVFAAVILSGIVLWWPATRRALKAGLTINPDLSGRPWNLNLHKAVGIYAAVVLLASALTGVPIAFDWAKNALYPLTASSKETPPPHDRAAGKPFAGFTAVGHKLGALWPGAHETYVPLPKKGVLTAYVIAADAPHPSARSYAWFDPADATLLRATPYAAASRGFRLYYWMMSFHTGLIGGWGMQVFLFLGALAIPLLAYTGTASFLRRKFRRPAPGAANGSGPAVRPPAGA